MRTSPRRRAGCTSSPRPVAGGELEQLHPAGGREARCRPRGRTRASRSIGGERRAGPSLPAAALEPEEALHRLGVAGAVGRLQRRAQGLLEAAAKALGLAEVVGLHVRQVVAVVATAEQRPLDLDPPRMVAPSGRRARLRARPRAGRRPRAARRPASGGRPSSKPRRAASASASSTSSRPSSGVHRYAYSPCQAISAGICGRQRSETTGTHPVHPDPGLGDQQAQPAEVEVLGRGEQEVGLVEGVDLVGVSRELAPALEVGGVDLVKPNRSHPVHLAALRMVGATARPALRSACRYRRTRHAARGNRRRARRGRRSRPGPGCGRRTATAAPRCRSRSRW